MSLVGENIARKRKQSDFSQNKLSKVSGVSQSAISAIESNTKSPSADTLARIAIALNCTVAELMGESVPFDIPNLEALPSTVKIPILGPIACGSPILAEENIEGYMDAPERIKADFCLRCVGDSMIGARIFDGDIVYIRKDETVIDGDIYAVLIDSEATLKRVYRIGKDRLELRAENPRYAVQRYHGAELEGIRFIGKAVAFLSTVR